MFGITDIVTYTLGVIFVVLLPGPNSLYVLSVAAQRGVKKGYRAGYFCRRYYIDDFERGRCRVAAQGESRIIQYNQILRCDLFSLDRFEFTTRGVG